MAPNKKIDINNIERFNPDIDNGLTSSQVEQRKKEGLVNKTKAFVGKTYLEIIINDVFNLFNVLLFIIAALMIYGEYYSGLFFLAVLTPNIIITLYQDIKAKRLMEKLRIMTAPKVNVIRDGQTLSIDPNELVLDDIMLIKGDSQISADGIIKKGTITLNESLLTGESDNVYKKDNDVIYSGSFSVSGEAYVQVNKVGKDSYIETIQSKAKSFKRSPSEILKSLRYLFRGITIIVIFMGIMMIVTNLIQGKMSTIAGFKETIGPLSGALVGMIPSGLYLLTSVALAVGVIALYRKKTLVQDFYSLEMLARTDILCVDKTGTITDGDMQYKQTVILDNKYTDKEIHLIISNILNATKDDNFTAKALKVEFNDPLTGIVKETLPFNSENKYSGATFATLGSFYLGALEYLNVNQKSLIGNKIRDYTSKGYRVLVLAKGDLPIIDHKAQGLLSPIAFIVLMDHIRESAVNTFSWFNENDVQVKVISGDNAETVSEIARQAGIKDSLNYISLEKLTDEEVKEAANKYNVFGRVSPEQKQILIESMHQAGHTVAMTGDGVNDILALKKADCSIAMASGSDAARKVSHLVLLDSNFDRLPSVVSEGRRVVNNLQRTSSLFLCKTMFAMVFSFIFLSMQLIFNNPNIAYPFFTNHMYLWEFFGIGITAFFLALEPSKERIKDKFLSNILKKAIPGGTIMIVSTLIYFLLYTLHYHHLVFTGVTSLEQAVSMATISMSIMCLVVLYRICKPFDKYRTIIFVGACVIDLLILGGFGLYDILNHTVDPLLKIGFINLDGINYFTILFNVVLFGALYLFIFSLIDLIKKRKKA
ncbi:MAG: HAD-IC family P-type ATPase [Bacilli bacterium]